jgi:hypothetical protein
VAEEREGEGYYRLLETIRQYGHERLVAAGEERPLRAAHGEWCLALARRAEPMVWGAGGDQRAWLDRLEAEHDNLRAALAWLLAEREDAAAELAGSLWQFWRVRGHVAEGRRWLRPAPAPRRPPGRRRCWARPSSPATRAAWPRRRRWPSAVAPHSPPSAIAGALGWRCSPSAFSG